MSLFTGVYIDVLGLYGDVPVSIKNNSVFISMSKFKHRRSPKKIRRQIITKVSAQHRSDVGAALLHFYSQRYELEGILK